MTFRRATVLGCAHEAVKVSDELRAAGVAVDTWILPDECGTREAARIAAQAAVGGEWADRLAGTEITVTVFRNPEILSQAVVPYVLPRLPIGSVWLQMGLTADAETDRLAHAAADHEISFLNVQPAGKAGSHPIPGLPSAHRRTIPQLFAWEPFASGCRPGRPGPACSAG